MTQYAIATDLNRCVGCLACSVTCKVVNDVPIGSYWNKVLTVQCQHCADPECVKVCPTGASHKLEDGTVQIDKSKCIGCQFCAMSCPYGVRYLNEEERVVEKCTLCEQKIAQGELPQCVTQCGGRARYFGDLEQGIAGFEGPAPIDIASRNVDYDATVQSRAKLVDEIESYAESDVYRLPNVGNNPSFVYILRNRTWQGGGE